jgi:hypothetical protein
MTKLIQRLIIIALAIFVILFVYLNLAEACGKWVLEDSQITGHGYKSGLINLCYYQDLEGSGQTLKMRLPVSKSCPIILDPCPEGGSDTTVTINQKSDSNNKFDKLMEEYLQLKNQ